MGKKLAMLLMKDTDVDSAQVVRVLEFLLYPPRYIKISTTKLGSVIKLAKCSMPHLSETTLKSLYSKGLVIKASDVETAVSVANHLVITLIKYLPTNQKCTIDFNNLCKKAMVMHVHSSPVHVNTELVMYLINQGARPPADEVIGMIQLEQLNSSSALYCMSTASHSNLSQFLKKTMHLKLIGAYLSMYTKLYGSSFLMKLVQNLRIEKTIAHEADVHGLEEPKSDNEESDSSSTGHESKNDDAQEDYNFDDLPWEVECSSYVHKILKSKHFVKLRPFFFRIIHQIASGNRSDALQKSVIKENGPPLFEAKLSKGARIIWEEALQFSPKHSQANYRIYTEVIRVWDIETDHDKLHKTISKTSKRRKDSYQKSNIQVNLSRCKCKKSVSSRSGTDPVLPKQFIEVDSSTAATINQKPYVLTPARCTENGNSTAKFYSCSFEYANSILKSNNERRDFPFKEWPKEHDIINMPEGQPILLLGRSGTGKSICCLYRMWNIFKNFWKEISQASDDSSIDESLLHQVFITKSKRLCDYTKKCFYNMAASQEYLDKHMQYERPPKACAPSKVPTDDLSYPLFLTSKEFLFLLDGSLDGAHFFSGARTTDSEVTSSIFETSVWPKLKNKSRVFDHFNPALVWMEIISIIKGSYEAMQQEKGCLSKKEYICFGQKMAPSFSESEREHIYDIFEMYCGYLQKNEKFDECDLLFNIYNRVKANPQRDWKISHFYVDEVQDFTQAELSIIIHLSSEPNNLFLTGDTAQTITKGVYFRFCDLRSLFHKEASHIGIPEIKTLEINFRSHSGILNLAASVIDLMKHYFSRFFDSHLPTDQGIFSGPTPIIFLVKDTVFGASKILFGANQAIIVWNDEAKQQLNESKKLEGIILTVHEAKGLEYEDVLLYNIFDSSQVSP